MFIKTSELMFKLILRAVAIIFIGFVSAVLGFAVGSIFFTTFIPEFVIFGREGYEAGGPIGFILGAMIGLIASSVLLFRKPIQNERWPKA